MAERTQKLTDDCFIHDKDRLRHADALAILKDRLAPVVPSEVIPLDCAHGRILATAITAPRDIPAFDNSAVDGYAYNAADYSKARGLFTVTARIVAGSGRPEALPPGAAARIFTGAIMPPGADTIAMQEDCQLQTRDGAGHVAIPPGLKPGANRRLAGEDAKQGTCLIEPGEYLNARAMAAIASTGLAQLSIYQRLHIGLLSSGDELLRPGRKFINGRVYDSNHYMLKGLLEQIGVEVIDLGICPDQAEMVTDTLKNAAANHDVIISSGGASRGEEDHFIDALTTLGKRHLWQLAVKPGRPMSFGQIGGVPVFTLPGNPVAAFVCFQMYVRPALIRLSGGNWVEPKRYPVPAGFEINYKKPDRREFLRGILEVDDAGKPLLKKFARDGSGLITGLREADGLIELPERVTRVQMGDMLDFIPFSEFVQT